MPEAPQEMPKRKRCRPPSTTPLNPTTTPRSTTAPRSNAAPPFSSMNSGLSPLNPGNSYTIPKATAQSPATPTPSAYLPRNSSTLQRPANTTPQALKTPTPSAHLPRNGSKVQRPIDKTPSILKTPAPAFSLPRQNLNSSRPMNKTPQIFKDLTQSDFSPLKRLGNTSTTKSNSLTSTPTLTQPPAKKRKIIILKANPSPTTTSTSNLNPNPSTPNNHLPQTPIQVDSSQSSSDEAEWNIPLSAARKITPASIPEKRVVIKPKHPVKRFVTRQEEISEHVEISTSIILSSKSIITLLIGPPPTTQTFHIHKDLLILHSKTFKDLLSPFPPPPSTSPTIKPEPPSLDPATTYDQPLPPPPPPSKPKEITKLSLQNIPPLHFSTFTSYIYSGSILSSLLLTQTTPHQYIPLYILSLTLQSPLFQNHILNLLCLSFPVRTGTWPTPSITRYIYENTRTRNYRDCGLRRFVAACIAVMNPFGKGEGEGEEVREWMELYREEAGMGIEVLRASGRWGGGEGGRERERPWDEGVRGEWMVECEGVGELWRRLILERRGREEVRRGVDSGCVGSLVEFSHLCRVEGVGEGEEDGEEL